MAYLKQADLLKRIIASAEKDREGFIGAVGHDSEMAEETRGEMARIQAVAGKPLREALLSDREAVRLACLFSESWYYGLADAQVGAEKKQAFAMWKTVHAFRMKTFGKTEMESRMAGAISVDVTKIHDFLAKAN